jgi:hypothetical protein
MKYLKNPYVIGFALLVVAAVVYYFYNKNKNEKTTTPGTTQGNSVTETLATTGADTTSVTDTTQPTPQDNNAPPTFNVMQPVQSVPRTGGIGRANIVAVA